jgi:hypothetical protein
MSKQKYDKKKGNYNEFVFLFWLLFFFPVAIIYFITSDHGQR